MDTALQPFDGVQLIVPTKGFEWIHPTFKDFPTMCGAGKLGDLIVPDTIYLMKISPACWIHDQMWILAEPTWADFHYSNNVFLENLRLINEARSWCFMKTLRTPRIHLYHHMVNTAGAYFFWLLKSSQGKAQLQEALNAIEEGKAWLKQ